MTALEACERIESAINALHTESRDKGWDWAYTTDLTDAEHLENYRESLAKTREHFGLPEETAMQFISVGGESTIIALCGNSPTAAARAEYLAWVNPANVSLLIAEIKSLKAQLAEAEEAVRHKQSVIESFLTSNSELVQIARGDADRARKELAEAQKEIERLKERLGK